MVKKIFLAISIVMATCLFSGCNSAGEEKENQSSTANSVAQVTIQSIDEDDITIDVIKVPSVTIETTSSSSPASSSSSPSPLASSSKESSKPDKSPTSSSVPSSTPKTPSLGEIADLTISNEGGNSNQGKGLPSIAQSSGCSHSFSHSGESPDGQMHLVVCMKCGIQELESIVKDSSGNYSYNYCGKSANSSTFERYQEELREFDKKPKV